MRIPKSFPSLLCTLAVVLPAIAHSAEASVPATPPAAVAPVAPVAPAAAAEVQPQESVDTTDAAPAAPPVAPPAAPPAAPAPEAGSAATDSMVTAAVASVDSAALASPEPLVLRNASISRLDLSGTFQLKALYHNFTSEYDANKRLSLQLRRFKLSLEAGLDSHSGFRGEFLVDGNGKSFGVENTYLFYTVNEFVGFKGGKMNRPFSQEALQSSKSLYTIERGELYHDFLANTTGYAYQDLGVVAYGGFNEDGASLTYELGVFNGKQNNDAAGNYGGQQYEGVDKGFKAKDVVFRLAAAPFKPLKLEAAVSTKAADDMSDSRDFKYAVNTAYEVGGSLTVNQLRLLGEVSWGDNHMKQDAKIVDGGVNFFAFYATGVWHQDYTRGRASEMVLKLEGLDPDFAPGQGEGAPNDGLLRYTTGVNYFFTKNVSAMANYGVLQPITKVAGKDGLTQDFDLLWRMSF
jgi:phosphate-selective porin O/P